MTVHEIYDAFNKMFPQLAAVSVKYKKIGSKAIAVTMKNGKSLVFLYNNEDDWTLGTKLWRQRPVQVERKVNE